MNSKYSYHNYVVALSTYIHTIVVVHTIFIRLHRRLFVVKDTIQKMFYRQLLLFIKRQK